MAVLRILTALALLAQSASAALEVDLDSTGEFSQSLSLYQAMADRRVDRANESTLFSVAEVDLFDLVEIGILGVT